MNSVGHMGCFRKEAEMIWSDIVKIFDGFI